MEGELCSPETRMLSVDRESATVQRSKVYWSSLKKHPRGGRIFVGGGDAGEALKLAPTPSLIEHAKVGRSKTPYHGLDTSSSIEEEHAFQDEQVVKNKFENEFTVLDNLGKGVFGSVYKVKSKLSGRISAVKQIRERFLGEQDRDRKSSEFAKWSKIVCCTPSPFRMSYCLDLYEAWEENGHLLLNGEYCENGNLWAWLHSRSPLHEGEIWDVLLDMACAIKQVHDSNCVHLDIKPENFFVKCDGTVKLGDFGHVYDLSEPHPRTVEEGDATYMSPELLDHFYPRVTKRADIFSFGISLIEISKMVKLKKNGRVWRQIREGKPSQVLDLWPRELAELIDRMTEKDPFARPSIDQILNHRRIRFQAQQRSVDSALLAYGERSTSAVRPFLADEPRPRFDKFTSRRFIEESLKNLRRIYRVQENRLHQQHKEH